MGRMLILVLNSCMFLGILYSVIPIYVYKIGRVEGVLYCTESNRGPPLILHYFVSGML